MNMSQRRRQVFAVIDQLETTNAPAAKTLTEYIKRLESALDTSFDLLATSNIYTRHISEAWEVLGRTVDKTHSRQNPFNLDDEGNYLDEGVGDDT